MCDRHSTLECFVVFSGVKLSIRSFNLLFGVDLSNSLSETYCKHFE